MFCCGWGGNQFTPLLIMYRDAAGYSVLTVDAFLGAYVVGLVPALLTVGALSDRFGRRPVMMAGTVASLLASGLLALGETGPVPIFLGRFVTGVAVAVAMAVGSTWVKELSDPPHDPDAGPGTGARRAALALTVGFGLGAGVAGVLAQWGPWPMVLPYVVHVALTVGVLLVLPRCVETRGPGRAGRLAVPAVRHPRFRRVVLPMAPWVFGSSGVAYAIMPQVVGDRLGSWGLAYSTLLTVCTLGAGALVQPIAKRLDRVTDARAVIVSMIAMSTGLALSVVAASVRSPWLALAAAIVLGSAYGIAVVSGLLEIQRLARPDELAGLTGVYYALAYVGFLLPAALAVLSKLAGYPVLLSGLVLIALAGTAVIARSSRSHLPGSSLPASSAGNAGITSVVSNSTERSETALGRSPNASRQSR
ncbi:MFS transporter [Pseudonocardia sp. K10HN5]|uniref:MFS transporter n=2 Tax=Pseudonocardia acidicola TaxID=2724939 RepID=A0ABX1S4S9_9PSEU|nr:MFS transporter [Pseudonocardia acidicola]NMH95767.1 MFS transporter [Pseudonocardia acidicola]